jgi:hypothetical protein
MDRTDYRYNLEYRAAVRKQMLVLASQLLAGELGVIDVSRKMSRFIFVGVEPEVEALLRVFSGISSETDALPVGNEREFWSPEALKREDPSIVAAERKWAGEAIEAATKLVRLLETST